MHLGSDDAVNLYSGNGRAAFHESLQKRNVSRVVCHKDFGAEV